MHGLFPFMDNKYIEHIRYEYEFKFKTILL